MGNFRPDSESTHDHDHELVTEDELFQDDAPASRRGLVEQGAPALHLEELAPRRVHVRAGDLLANKYRVERVHPPGALGVTCEAVHRHLDQRVAIKLCVADQRMRSERAARFLRGARLAAQFRNEHIARVLDLGSLDSGVPYSVTEHLSGIDLRGVLRVREWLPVTEAVDYVLQACEGLAEAHAAGLVHRNLKLSNVFLCRNQEGRPSIRVLDFCLVDGPLADPSITLGTSESVVSSFAYLAPEQIREPESVDGRADIWALGAILHELVTGVPLYAASTVPGIFAAIAADPVPAAAEQRPEVPRELDEVLLRCLEKERAYRWSDLGTLARQLKRFASPQGRDTVDRVIAVLERRVGSTRSLLPPTMPGVARPRSAVRLDTLPPPREAPPGRRLLEISLAALAVIGVSVGVGAFVAIHNLRSALAMRAASERSVVASLSPALPASPPPVLAAAPKTATSPPSSAPRRAALKVWNKPAPRHVSDATPRPGNGDSVAPLAAPPAQALFDDAN